MTAYDSRLTLVREVSVPCWRRAQLRSNSILAGCFTADLRRVGFTACSIAAVAALLVQPELALQLLNQADKLVSLPAVTFALQKVEKKMETLRWTMPWEHCFQWHRPNAGNYCLTS